MARVILLLAALLAGPASFVAAHEVPATVVVQVYVRPEGQRLRLLVRAPLAAMRDVEFPQRGPGYLELERVHGRLRDAALLWLAGAVSLYEGEERLGSPELSAVRASLPSDRSFADYATALAHVTGPPLPADTALPWTQASIDVLLEYPIRAADSDFAIDPGFARLGGRVVTVLRFVPANGPSRAFDLTGSPGRVRLDPRWHQAAGHFVGVGFRHILDGLDHLLFLVCLVIPLRRIGPLVVVVTSFTAAHSVALIGSAFDLAPGALWFPPLIEALIALSIVYMAFENIAGVQVRHRWLLAFGFGLVHGFGFSFGLRESLQFAGSHLTTALVSFNLGVELGQLAVLVVLVPLLAGLFRLVVSERIGTILLSALVAHTGWHWMLERGAALGQFRFEFPALDAALMAAVLRWLMLALVLAGVGWLLSGLAQRWAPPVPGKPVRPPAE